MLEDGSKQAKQSKQAWNRQRRTQRVRLDISVWVYGHSSEKEPFREVVNTRAVNANGALLLMSARVELGQQLIVANMATEEEQACKVVYLGEEHGDKTEVGIEFMTAAPRFWHIAFPPEDWKRTRRSS